MKRFLFVIICTFLLVAFSFSTHAQKSNLNKDFGIGLQGATPEFGGVSFRYTGLTPLYLQTVGRIILNDKDSDHMIGAGVSYAIFEHHSTWNISRLYFTLEGAWQYMSEEDMLTTTLAAGIAFGGELLFSLGGIPLGLNVEVGQGFGRETYESDTKGLAGVYVGMGIHAYF